MRSDQSTQSDHGTYEVIIRIRCIDVVVAGMVDDVMDFVVVVIML